MGPTSKAGEEKEERKEGRKGKGEGRGGKTSVGLLSTKNNNADISQPEQIFMSSSKIVRFPKFIHT